MQRAYLIRASAFRSSSEWNSAVAASSALGFDTLLVALSGGNVFTDRVCDDLDMAKLVALATERSLRIILEVPISFVPATSPAARMLSLSGSSTGARDPRVSPADRQNIPIPFSDETKSRTWINALRVRLLEFEKLGIADFCFDLRPGTPEWIFPLLAGSRQSEVGNSRISLWASLDHLVAVPKFDGRAFAGAFLPTVSLFEAGTLAHLIEASRIFGKVILSAAEPFVSRAKFQHSDDATVEKRSRFLLWASAALGDGILVPMGFEYGLATSLDRSLITTKNWSELAAEHPFDLSQTIAAANALVQVRSSSLSRPHFGRLAQANSLRQSGALATKRGFALSSPIRRWIVIFHYRPFLSRARSANFCHSKTH